jgi:hypothetical protein
MKFSPAYSYRKRAESEINNLVAMMQQFVSPTDDDAPLLL